MLINEITEKTGLSKKAVRLYEDKGLISVSRSENGYRTYTDENLEALKKIKLLRLAGISISDIRLLFSGVIKTEELISKRESEIRKEGGDIAQVLSRLRSLADGGTLEGAEGELDESFADSSPVEEAIIGIDIGTTTISAVVIDLKTKKAAESYTLIYGAEIERAEKDFKERDASLIIEKALSLTDHIINSYGKISAIGVTGQMHGIAYLDKKGDVVSPLYTWQDRRADRPADSGVSYCDEMNLCLSERVAAGYGLATHYYNQKNGIVPENAHTVATIMDIFVMRLTNSTSPLMHTSDAASLGLFNTEKKQFNKEAMERLNVKLPALPEVSADYKIAGSYKGIPVSVAIGDNQASFIGSVKDTEKALLVNIGTGSQICATANGYKADKILETRPLNGEKYILCGSSLYGGASYSLLEKFFRAAVRESGSETASCYEMMNSMAERAYRSGVKPLNVNTCFAGQRHNTAQKGAVTEITPESFTPEAMTLGFIYGMCLELRDMFGGTKSKEYIVASGNAAQKIPIMKDVLKDVFGLDVYICDGKEEASLGAALFAAISAGLISEDGAKDFISYK